MTNAPGPNVACLSGKKIFLNTIKKKKRQHTFLGSQVISYMTHKKKINIVLDLTALDTFHSQRLSLRTMLIKIISKLHLLGA